VLKQIHERLVKIAQAKGVITGRRMRVDTTVVETNIYAVHRINVLCGAHDYAESRQEVAICHGLSCRLHSA
jgi:hypothetical protein